MIGVCLCRAYEFKLQTSAVRWMESVLTTRSVPDFKVIKGSVGMYPTYISEIAIKRAPRSSPESSRPCQVGLVRIATLNFGGAVLRIFYSYLQARLTWKWRGKLTRLMHAQYFAGINYYLIGPGGGRRFKVRPQL